MVPHERSLVQRLQAKPFALLGVNTDSRERYPAIVREGGVTWRNWLDGSTDGPITKRWSIHMFPTVYLIDAEGIIRYKDVDFQSLRGDKLDEAVETLLGEVDGRARSLMLLLSP